MVAKETLIAMTRWNAIGEHTRTVAAVKMRARGRVAQRPTVSSVAMADETGAQV